MSGLTSIEAVVYVWRKFWAWVRTPICRKRQSDEADELFIPELAGVSVLFWTCPEHPGGKVTWAHIAKDPGGIQNIATCEACGRKSC